MATKSVAENKLFKILDAEIDKFFDGELSFNDFSAKIDTIIADVTANVPKSEGDKLLVSVLRRLNDGKI